MSQSDNVDLNEIDKFSNLAKLWWDTTGKMGMLHVINPLRMAFIEKHTDLANRRVLDVGCGGGILTEALAKAGAHVTGIDLAKTPLEVAKQHAKQEGLDIDYRYESVSNLQKKHTGKFDVIACLEMLEHVPDPSMIIKDCVQLLKPDGHIFFSTINRNFKAYLFAIIGAEYILRIMPKGTHSYKKLIRPAELQRWALDNGLVLTKISSFMYNPIKKSFKLKDKADINYITHFVRGERIAK